MTFQILSKTKFDIYNLLSFLRWIWDALKKMPVL